MGSGARDVVNGIRSAIPSPAWRVMTSWVRAAGGAKTSSKANVLGLYLGCGLSSLTMVTVTWRLDLVHTDLQRNETYSAQCNGCKIGVLQR